MNNIVVFDIETTGVDKKKDHIIQFSAIKYDRDNKRIIDEYNTYIKPYGSYTMSVGSLAIHQITPKFLEDKPYFIDVANDILKFFEGCDLLSYNGLSFDAPFLKREFAECGIEWNFSEYNFYDAYKEELRRNGNTLKDVYKRYTGKSMEDAGYKAHDASADIKATLEVFIAQTEIMEYPPEQILTEDGFIKIKDFCGKETECFSVGKWNGVSVEYVAKHDKSYLSWIINSNDFDKKTKMICESYLH